MRNDLVGRKPLGHARGMLWPCDRDLGRLHVMRVKSENDPYDGTNLLYDRDFHIQSMIVFVDSAP
jgi:hypothetical protein